jgi:hypothetical protein
MSEVLGIDETLLRVGSLVALAGGLAASAFVLSRVEDPTRLLAGLRERFVFGAPWGTITVIALVVAVYYLLQGGGKAGGPIVTGFRSWSLWYPQGMLFSSFAHFSDGHLTGNLIGTVAFAPLAEYVWRHYPDEADLTGWRANPYARIGLFVLGVGAVGILGSVIVPGAVIGFSGVVFAFAGFTIVTAPIKTVFAIAGIHAVRLLYNAVTNPVIVDQAREQFVRPSWANIAVQGHLYGLLVGVLVGVALLRCRNHEPRIYAVFAAALAFAITRSLQSVYWFLGGETYVLFTAVGAAGVFVLATVVAVAARHDEASLPYTEVRAGTAAAGILLAVVVALAVIGVPYNLAPVEGGPATESADRIEVRDYTVVYAENVEDRYISAVELPGFGGTSVARGGVIVVSERRNSWEVAVSERRLATQRSATIALGDATWRETVDIRRTGWELAGSNLTYKVFGNHDDERRQLDASEGATARLQINGSTVTIRPAEEFYEVVLERENDVLGVERIPDDGEEITIGDIRFSRDGTALLAAHEGTVVQVAAYRP